MSSSDSDPEARRLAVIALLTREGPEVTEGIVAALADPDWRVRKEAASAAAHVREPSLLPRLVDALLQPEDVGLRNAAIEAFGHIGARGAPALIDALERAPSTARKFVCAALGGTGADGVPALSRLALDPDPNTATVALESLARIGGPAAEQGLLALLSAADWVVRLAALEGLSVLGSQVPVETLAPMVDDPLLRRFALRLLGKAHDPAALAPLLRALSRSSASADLAEVVVAIAALTEGGGDHAHARIEDVARALEPSTRQGLRELVGGEEVGAARAAAEILALARDLDALGAIAALGARAELGPGGARALQRFGREAIRPLIAVSPRLDPGARAWALEVAAELAAIELAPGQALGQDAPEAVAIAGELRHALRKALNAREEIVVNAAARGLSHWAEPADAETLIRLGARHGGAVARAAGSALEALSHAAPDSVERAISEAPPDGAQAWSAAISALSPASALEKLRAAISSDDAGTRRAALAALGRLDSIEAAEVASVALADEDIDVRVAAARALSEMRSAEARDIALPTLRVALRESSPAVRATAARALGALGDEGARDALRDLLRDAGPGVALAALSSLRSLSLARATDLEELIVDALAHPDEEVVKEGLRALLDADLPRKEQRLALGLSHPAWDVRRLAASLLGTLGTPAALEALRARDPIEHDTMVKAEIAGALEGGLSRRGGPR